MYQLARLAPHLDQPHIRRQRDPLPRVLLSLELVVGGRVHHLADHGVLVQGRQERLRLLVFADLHEIMIKIKYQVNTIL